MKDILISNFSDALFQEAFKKYFQELGINVNNWDGLFKEMNDEGGNKAYVRVGEDEKIIGFIQFKDIQLSNWFFTEKLGFIREFWISKEKRSEGHGTALLQLAEKHFRKEGIHKTILTTDTAEHFYEMRGYRKDEAYNALNEDAVFVKHL